MNILFLSDHYLQDSRLLETIGKAIKGSNHVFTIVPDGRTFGFDGNNNLTDHQFIIEESSLIETAKKNIYGVLGKRLVGYLAEGPVPAVTISGDQKNIIKIDRDDRIEINFTELEKINTQQINSIFCPFAKKNETVVYCSPLKILSEFQKAGHVIYYLNEHLPPDGISKYAELKIWAESDTAIFRSFHWIDEWVSGTTIHFLNLLKLKQFAINKQSLLGITR